MFVASMQPYDSLPEFLDLSRCWEDHFGDKENVQTFVGQSTQDDLSLHHSAATSGSFQVGNKNKLFDLVTQESPKLMIPSQTAKGTLHLKDNFGHKWLRTSAFSIFLTHWVHQFCADRF